MFTMRLKLGPARNNEWRCCFCLHVRTATIILGVWHMILHVLALSVIALIYRNHHAMNQQNQYGDVDPSNLLPTPLSKVKDGDIPYYLPTTQDGNGRTVYSEVYPSDMDMGALMTICTLSLTLLLVYGTIKEKAIYLLPFLCLLLFDFIITTLTATSYFCYLRSVHQFVNDHWANLPYQKQILELSPQYLSLLILLLFLISMLWKAYCVSIVWRCYKYLTLRQQQTCRGGSTVHYILPGNGSLGPDGLTGIGGGPDHHRSGPDYSSLLPDYEAACAASAMMMKQPPPPSYQMAVLEAGGMENVLNGGPGVDNTGSTTIQILTNPALAPPAFTPYAYVITDTMPQPTPVLNNNTPVHAVSVASPTNSDEQASSSDASTTIVADQELQVTVIAVNNNNNNPPALDAEEQQLVEAATVVQQGAIPKKREDE